jgi:hypothetical protein
LAKVIGFETLTVAAAAAGPTASALEGPTLAVGATATDTQNAFYKTKGMGANYALFGPLETAQIRWRDDGTAPTAAVGHLLEVGQVLEYDGDLNKISFIRTGGTSGSLPATYFRRSKSVL